MVLKSIQYTQYYLCSPFVTSNVDFDAFLPLSPTEGGIKLTVRIVPSKMNKLKKCFLKKIEKISFFTKDTNIFCSKFFEQQQNKEFGLR